MGNKLKKIKANQAKAKQTAQAAVINEDKSGISAMIDRGDYTAAMDEIARLAAAKIMDADLAYQAAYCYFMTGDYERASAWINNTFRYETNHIPARLLLARLCIIEDRTDDGMKLYEFVLTTYGNKLTEEQREEIEEVLDFYARTEREMIVNGYPKIAEFMKLTPETAEKAAPTGAKPTAEKPADEKLAVPSSDANTIATLTSRLKEKIAAIKNESAADPTVAMLKATVNAAKQAAADTLAAGLGADKPAEEKPAEPAAEPTTKETPTAPESGGILAELAKLKEKMANRIKIAPLDPTADEPATAEKSAEPAATPDTPAAEPISETLTPAAEPTHATEPVSETPAPTTKPTPATASTSETPSPVAEPTPATEPVSETPAPTEPTATALAEQTIPSPTEPATPTPTTEPATPEPQAQSETQPITPAAVLARSISLADKIRVLNAFAGAHFLADRLDDADAFLAAALTIDDRDPATIRNLVVLRRAQGDNAAAQELAAKLPTVDFALLALLKK